jgi:hypothetical protein
MGGGGGSALGGLDAALGVGGGGGGGAGGSALGGLADLLGSGPVRTAKTQPHRGDRGGGGGGGGGRNHGAPVSGPLRPRNISVDWDFLMQRRLLSRD